MKINNIVCEPLYIFKKPICQKKSSNFFKTELEIIIYQLSAINGSDATHFLWCLNFVKFYKYPLQIGHTIVISEINYAWEFTYIYDAWDLFLNP